MELRYRREVLVGLLLIASAIAFVLLLLWLKGQPFRSGHLVNVTFVDVSGLKDGDQVMVAGVLVGNVRKISLDPSNTKVNVLMDISHGPAPHTDARFTVRALDLLGARFVDYAPGSSPQLLPKGGLVQGLQEPELADMASSLGGEGRTVMANAADLVGPRTTAQLRATLVEAQRALAAIGNAASKPSDTLTAALAQLRRIGQRLDLLLQNTSDPAAATMRNFQQASSNMARMSETLTHTSATLDSLLTRINSGRGTLGQLTNDTTTLSELRATNRALYDLITDFRANPRKYINVRVF